MIYAICIDCNVIVLLRALSITFSQNFVLIALLMELIYLNILCVIQIVELIEKFSQSP